MVSHENSYLPRPQALGKIEVLLGGLGKVFTPLLVVRSKIVHPEGLLERILLLYQMTKVRSLL